MYTHKGVLRQSCKINPNSLFYAVYLNFRIYGFCISGSWFLNTKSFHSSDDKLTLRVCVTLEQESDTHLNSTAGKYLRQINTRQNGCINNRWAYLNKVKCKIIPINYNLK